MNKKMQFSIDHYDVLLNDKTSMILDCYIVHSGVNRKGTSFSLESIQNAIPSLANKPLLVLWDYGKNDFTDHGNELNRDKLVFIGNIPESNAAEIVEYKGEQFLKARCVVWKQYHPNVVERFERNDVAKISMEIDVDKYYVDDKDIIHIEDFIFSGICLLGDSGQYREGIANANIHVLQFTDSETAICEDYNNKYYCWLDKYPVPQGILETLKEQINLPQKSYNVSQFCKYIVEKEAIPYSTITEWYSKITNTRKDENYEYYGGSEAETYLETTIAKYAVSKDDRFSGDTIPLKLTVEDADDTTAWGEVDKTDLLNRSLKAQNGKQLIQSTYLVVPENWEEAPSTYLKYPIAFIKKGIYIYSINGVQAANQRLEQDVSEDYYDEARKKLDSIYNKLNLNDGERRNEYSMDYEDLMQLLSKILFEKGQDEYGMPIYRYFACGDEYVIAGKITEDGFKFIKMAYEIEDDVPSIKFDTEIEVFPKTDYLELKSEDSNYTVSNVMDDIYSVVATKQSKYQETLETYSHVDETIDGLKTEILDLQQYKDKALKAEKDIQASKLYTKYGEYISDEEREGLDSILYTEDFKAFESAVNRKILPILEAKYTAIREKGKTIQGKTVDADEPENKTKPVELNYSNMPKKNEKGTKGNSMIGRLTSYLGN